MVGAFELHSHEEISIHTRMVLVRHSEVLPVILHNQIEVYTMVYSVFEYSTNFLPSACTQDRHSFLSCQKHIIGGKCSLINLQTQKQRNKMLILSNMASKMSSLSRNQTSVTKNIIFGVECRAYEIIGIWTYIDQYHELIELDEQPPQIFHPIMIAIHPPFFKYNFQILLNTKCQNFSNAKGVCRLMS